MNAMNIMKDSVWERPPRHVSTHTHLTLWA